MGITEMSAIVLPLCLLWCSKPMRLLQLILIGDLFEAAAVLTLGSLGVQTGLAPGAIFLGFVTVQLLLGVHYPLSRQVWRIVRPFVLVVLWAVLSSFIMPLVFEGQVYVWPQKMEPPFAISLLEPNFGCVNQDIYIIVDCCVVVLGALYLTKPSVSLTTLINAYLLSGVMAAALALWQLGNKLAGLPYPSDLLYSNPGWAVLTGQQVGLVPQINGPFSEPSALSCYMGTIVCSCVWTQLQGHKFVTTRVLLVLSLLIMVLTTSTTGFGVLAIIGCGIPLYAVSRGNTRMISTTLNIGIVLMVTGGLALFTINLTQPSVLNDMQDVVDGTLNKQESSSYQERTSADIDSLTAFQDSFGFGAGWGNNRSSSLIPGILASLGLPGMAGLVWFAIVLGKHVRHAKRCAPSQDELFIIDACCGALTGFILAGIISGPTIGSLTFYLLLAMLVACVARVEMTASTRTSCSSKLRATEPNAVQIQRKPPPQDFQKPDTGGGLATGIRPFDSALRTSAIVNPARASGCLGCLAPAGQMGANLTG